MKDQTFVGFILDQLNGLAGVRTRGMFGGHGIYRGEDFFAIVYQGRLYFKTGAENRAAYLERGMEPFRPNRKQELGGYYEVPLDVIEDPPLLTTWARAALRVATSGGSHDGG